MIYYISMLIRNFFFPFFSISKPHIRSILNANMRIPSRSRDWIRITHKAAFLSIEQLLKNRSNVNTQCITLLRTSKRTYQIVGRKIIEELKTEKKMDGSTRKHAEYIAFVGRTMNITYKHYIQRK